MPIEPVAKPEEEKVEENKPLLNIQLPAPMAGDPNAPLSVGRHNAAAQHNFQQIANILLTIINNQKIMGLAVKQITDKQVEIEKNVNTVSENIRKLKLLEENDENAKPSPTTATE